MIGRSDADAQFRFTFQVGVGLAAASAAQLALCVVFRDWRLVPVGLAALTTAVWLAVGIPAAAGGFAALASRPPPPPDGDDEPGAAIYGLIGLFLIGVTVPTQLVVAVVFF